jgi:sulfur relay protein TusB/DsrH
MKRLHILRKTNDPLAMEAIQHERRLREVGVLLLQDGVLAKGDFPDPTYVCGEDLAARGIKSRYRVVDYETIARLMVEYDRVTTW